jgi:hypothetical protein
MLSVIIHYQLSDPTMLLTQQLVYHWLKVKGPLVLPSLSLKFPTPIEDRIQTALRRSKPISCDSLIGEQPNPWELFHPQAESRRHRGAKQSRRYELSKTISLLSLEYLLSVERWPFHEVPPDHYDQLAFLLDPSVLQLSRLFSHYGLQLPN